MLVGLDDPTARECSQLLRPLVCVRVADVKEACAKLSEVLPLIVLVDERIAKSPELVEIVGACAAELVPIGPRFDRDALSLKLLDSIRKAEDRRIPR